MSPREKSTAILEKPTTKPGFSVQELLNLALSQKEVKTTKLSSTQGLMQGHLLIYRKREVIKVTDISETMINGEPLELYSGVPLDADILTLAGFQTKINRMQIPDDDSISYVLPIGADHHIIVEKRKDMRNYKAYHSLLGYYLPELEVREFRLHDLQSMVWTYCRRMVLPFIAEKN